MSAPTAPTHNPEVRSGPNTYITLSGREGIFKIERKGHETRTAVSLRGRPTELIFEWDAEGSQEHNIPPRWEVALQLEDVTFGEEEIGRALLQVGAPVTVSTLVERIYRVEPGEWAFIAANKGTRSTFINVFRWDATKGDEGAWEEQREKLTEGTSAERYAQAVKLAWTLPLLNRDKSEPYDVDDASRVCPRGKAFTPPPLRTAGAVPPVQTAATPSQAERNAADKAAQDPSGDGTPASLPVFYTVTLPRHPLPAAWDEISTEGQLTAVTNKLAAKLGAAPTREQLATALAYVSGQFTESATKGLTKAAAGILYDFANNAGEEVLKKFWGEIVEEDPFS